ncbi:hypothetical protein HYW42_03370 [Candidatus Daviesbacteria bacterium]|nr:hypothetical protein [Candidatus Daviesbacteria bacterium]
MKKGLLSLAFFLALGLFLFPVNVQVVEAAEECPPAWGKPYPWWEEGCYEQGKGIFGQCQMPLLTFDLDPLAKRFPASACGRDEKSVPVTPSQPSKPNEILNLNAMQISTAIRDLCGEDKEKCRDEVKSCVSGLKEDITKSTIESCFKVYTVKAEQERTSVQPLPEVRQASEGNSVITGNYDCEKATDNNAFCSNKYGNGSLCIPAGRKTDDGCTAPSQTSQSTERTDTREVSPPQVAPRAAVSPTEEEGPGCDGVDSVWGIWEKGDDGTFSKLKQVKSRSTNDPQCGFKLSQAQQDEIAVLEKDRQQAQQQAEKPKIKEVKVNGNQVDIKNTKVKLNLLDLCKKLDSSCTEKTLKPVTLDIELKFTDGSTKRIALILKPAGSLGKKDEAKGLIQIGQSGCTQDSQCQIPSGDSRGYCCTGSSCGDKKGKCTTKDGSLTSSSSNSGSSAPSSNKGSGESCKSNKECRDGLICIGENDSRDFGLPKDKCYPNPKTSSKLPDGADCVSNAQCVSGDCRTGGTCDTPGGCKGKCIGGGKPGEFCRHDSECPSGYFCPGNNEAAKLNIQNDRCTPLSVRGSGGGSTSGGNSGGSSSSSSNSCGTTQRQPSGSKCLGESCSQDSECKTGYCCTGSSCTNRGKCTNANGSI